MARRAGWLLAACVAIASAAELRPYEAIEPHMGTLARIELYAADEQQAGAAFRAAFERIARLDAILSDYKDDSELNRVCRDAAGRPVRVSDDLFQVLAESQQLAGSTGGAFDVTAGPVIRLWREARSTNVLPDAGALGSASSRSGYRKLHLDAQHRTVMLDRSGMRLDLGGIAKGYAADAALAVLDSMGIRSALVALSGDLVFSNAPPGRGGWRIGIDSFDSAGLAFTRVLELSNAAVSTSGDAEQHLDAGGRRYSHIVDPSAGVALTRPITATVVAPRGVLADGASTAVSVLGAGKGMAFIEGRPDLAALIVLRDYGAPRVIESSRFRRLPHVRVNAQ